ncbi:MAG: hypothetical protein GKR86_01050 [Ilumatobacter sp.]|nr:hypothetical protein [Ilumatobacter sp.]
MDEETRNVHGIELRFVSIDTIAIGFDDPDMIARHLNGSEIVDLINTLVDMLDDIISED